MRVAICRIIGNELPPRDRTGGKLASLRWILEHPEELGGADRYWVVNHLFDADYRRRVLRLLDDFGQSYEELAFDPSRYRALPSERERRTYAINVNAARNHAIRLALAAGGLVACLDQDCWFLPGQWRRVVAFIEQDQVESPRRCYYGLRMKRLFGLPADIAEAHLAGLPDEEPQIIFRHDAPQRFDPSIPFGNGDKMRLLTTLGYASGPGYQLAGDRCRCAGTVLHLAAGEPEAERNRELRIQRRSESIRLLLRDLDAR